MGKSKGGNTTKIHMAAESNGMPIEFEMTGGEVHGCKIAVYLIAVLPPSEYTIADKGLVIPLTPTTSSRGLSAGSS